MHNKLPGTSSRSNGTRAKPDSQDNVHLIKIQKTPGVCGGRACVGSTRIPVWTLISFFQQGATDEGMIQAYPALTVDHLNLVRKYYEAHRTEIDCDIREQGIPARG